MEMINTHHKMIKFKEEPLQSTDSLSRHPGIQREWKITNKSISQKNRPETILTLQIITSKNSEGCHSIWTTHQSQKNMQQGYRLQKGSNNNNHIIIKKRISRQYPTDSLQ